MIEEGHLKEPGPSDTVSLSAGMVASSSLLLRSLSPPPSLVFLLLAVFIVELVGPSASKKDRSRFLPV